MNQVGLWLTGVCNCLGEVISEAYELEYGNDRLEMHVGAVERGERALIIDDLVATGGTLCAAIRLLGEVPKFSCSCISTRYIILLLQTQCFCCLERNGAEVVECACVIGLPELKVIEIPLLFIASHLALSTGNNVSYLLLLTSNNR